MRQDLLESSREVRSAARALHARLGAGERVEQMLHDVFDQVAAEPLPPDIARLASRL